ncbi:MAG TPA: immunoglobulin domain-containing protein, partial [Verrucomicrobiae bacterium]|nr:immunoglobulin domain-containing protein [Verrucomicrobiae bacterium]
FLAVDTLPIDDTLYERYETVSSVPVSGSAFPVGTTTVTNTVADACGNSTNTTFTVTVADVEPPSAIRPADITVTNDPGQCGAMVSFAIPTNTDNCGVASVVATPASGSIFPVGTTPVTVVVTDIHGNTNSCTFNVTVNDTEPPSANVPAEIVQANDPGQCGAIVNFTLPTQTDNCGVAVSTATPPSGSFFPVGTTVVTVVVTDIHGNAATNTFNVVVNDTELPVVTCPANIVQGVDPGQTYATVSFIPTATDNCAIQSIVATPASGSHFPVGINPVSVVATDIHGNTQTCSFTVQVVGLPQIVQQPMSRTNNAGTTATFSVAATSPTPLSYLWKKNGVAMSDGGNISGSATSTLMIGSVSNADVASYSVCVSNLAGAVLSSNATLTVIDPPVIVSQPMSVTNNATTTATFAVTVDGTEPFGYQWYKNGTNQLVDGGNISGSLSNILTLTNVLAADRGQYSVVVTNPAGVVVSSNATLSVVDPWIVTQPANTTQPLGGTATFSVSALGTTPLTYLWQQNGVGIPGATNSSYTISVIRDSDAGPYNVIVSSAGGSVTSSNATLTVTHPPVFVTQPSSQTVIQGQTASFNVTMNGTTPFTFQWQFNSVNIPGATSHSLTLSGVTTANAGDYDVLVTNADGFAISTQAVLTVIVPPSFVTQPTSITNNAGTTATFSVTANGTALTYQWFKNGTNSLSDGGNVSGSATATLTLSNVLGGDAGTYSVTIANLAGPLTSSNAALTVIDPVITNEPSNISVILGQPASFSVGAVGTSPVYQWRNGGIPIGNATNSSYSIASTADADAGSYDVIVTTIYGSVTSTPPAVLMVFDPAVVIHDPVSITRNAGTTASFTVVAGGTAPLTYQWLKNSSPLTDSGRIMGSLTSTLTISDVNDTDVSGYSVVVMNPYGTNTSGSASLTVIDPPVITNEPVSVTNNAGTTAVFTVGVSGTQPLSYQWYKNGTNQLADGGNVLGATSNILTLSNVFGIDRGDYSVIVTNVAGTATSSNATLSVIDPVITVQPTNITAIDGSTISFSVTTVGTLPLHYQWRQDDSDLADGFGISGSGTATLTITNVADSDEGNYSVVITNSEGVATSVEAVLTTVPPLIVFQPTNAYVLVGQPFSFSVSVNGVQPFSYQWVLNNTNINNATNRIYSVSAASFSDAGTYYVVVANTNGSETSANAVLQVYATAGSTVTFLGRTNGNANIELQGVPTFTYQLQASTDLSTTNWVPVATNTSPFIFIDTNHFPQRFYRGLYAP